MTSIINRGTGAGGANTTKNGGGFELKTSNEPRLYHLGFKAQIIPSSSLFYREKSLNGYIIRFLTQQQMKPYIEHFNNIKFGKSDGAFKPDEAYLLISQDSSKPNIIKIIEKKNQNTSGSVEDKLATYPLFVEFYQRCFPDYQVQYAYCLSNYLKQRYLTDSFKWQIMRELHKKNNITILFGDDDDYFDKLDNWIFEI